jgi:hypothetical protein
MVRDLYPARQVSFGKTNTITLHRTYSTCHLPTFTKNLAKKHFRNNENLHEDAHTDIGSIIMTVTNLNIAG